MKNMIKYNWFKAMALCGGIAVVTSCDMDKFLDITPPSQISPETYLYAEDQLAAYTFNYYGWLPSHDGSGGETYMFNDILTDNETSSGGNSRFLPGQWKVGSTGGDWSFDRIYAMNYYLQTVVPRLEKNEIRGVESNIKHYVGEGYFLRAWIYYGKLVALGDFPILKNTVPDNKEELIKASERRPRNEVARFILEDLDKAISLMNNSPVGGKSRLSKNTAILLKARVALFEATWEKYHAGTARVPGSSDWPGKTKSYLADYTYDANTEINFFLTQAMEAADQIASSIPLVENNGVLQANATMPANPYYNLFASHNPSSVPEVIFMREYKTDVLMHWYNHYIAHGANKGYTHQMEQSILMKNGLPIYATGSGYKGDDFIEDTKIDRDDRWRLFMKAPNEPKAFFNTTVPTFIENAPLVYSSDGKTSTSTGYMLGKAYSLDYNDQGSGKDITAAVPFRAAEAYLIYIEASWLKNGSIDSKADTYWRALRTRAGIDPDYNKTIAATDMSKEAPNDWGAYSGGVLVDATTYNIRRERRTELMGEGQRWVDVRRWRALDQLAKGQAQAGFQIEGCKIWGPQKDRYKAGDLVADQTDEKKNTMSSPSLSPYIRIFQKVKTNNLYFDGLFFCDAHYLSPIAFEHFTISSADGSDTSTSPIYQNPGWPVESGSGAIGF